MSRATFRFYEELNRFLPAGRRKRDIDLEFDHIAPVRHWIESFGVPHTEIEIILLNGTSVGLEQPVRDGDRVSVYPTFETLDVTPLLRLRRISGIRLENLSLLRHQRRRLPLKF